MKEQKSDLFQPGKLSLGTWLSSGSPVIAELASELPFDWLLFDLEHGCLSEDALLANLQAISRKDVQLIVRVPSINHKLINRILDWGASGIMIPHVTDRVMIDRCIDAIYYPPLGTRGYSGSARAYGYGLRRPINTKNLSRPLLIAQIEDLIGVQNIDEIAQSEIVDVLFAGPSDLKLNLAANAGKHSLTYEEALLRIVGAANKRKKQAGLLISDISQMDAMRKSGFSCLAVMSDLGILIEGYRKIIEINTLESKE